MEPIILPRISDKKPLVSVVSITYNQESYIRDCLEGFLIQETDFPIEIIIHDDASTDHTADIIREYYKKRPDLFHVIIERENCYSKNKPILVPLLEKTQGKYIALCEGDDYWTEPLKLQKQLDFMENHPDYSLCCHNAYVINIINGHKSIHKKIQDDYDITLKDVIEYKESLIRTASLFFRREFVQHYKVFKEQCPVGDLPLIVCMANYGRVHYIAKTMSVYRLYANNSWMLSQKGDTSRQIEHLKSMIRWFERIKKIINCDEGIEYKLSHEYYRLHCLEMNYKGLLQDERCKQIAKRQGTAGKLLYDLTICGVFIAYYSKSSFLYKVFNKTIFLKLLNLDGERVCCQKTPVRIKIKQFLNIK